MVSPKVLVLSGYGINCEQETVFAFERAGANAEVVHLNDLIDGHKKLQDYQILAFPGGFSYGDDTGAGKALANRIYNNLREELLEFVQRDTLTLATCNGFQAVTALGLLPALGMKYGERQAALMANNNARYTCRWIHMKCVSEKCVFTKGIETLYVPVAHGEGKFYMEPEGLKQLQANGQIIFTYVKEDGSPANGEDPYNPNGSLLDIAGVCDPSGRILGIMPHPERGLLFVNRPDFPLLKEKYRREGRELPQENEGIKIFQNAVGYFTKN